jgi:Ras-related protein Rab-23
MLARSLGCKLICTSVKDDVNVNNVFRYLATRCLMEIQKEEQEYMSGNGIHQTYTIGISFKNIFIFINKPLN